MRIVAVEGSIGAGKSTLMKTLPKHLSMFVGGKWDSIIEPVDSDPEFHRLLKQFIDNPKDADKRIEFQKYITNSRQMLLKDIPDGNYVIERSLFSDLVFSQMNFLTMERPSAHYMDYYYDIKKRLTDYPRIDAIVYLDADPSWCEESIKKRGREGEHYELSYLQDLKNFHDACLPQIAREYDTKLLTVELGSSYADSLEIACTLAKTDMI